MKPLGIFVIERKKCETCGGNGVFQHPIWAEFWNWRDEPGNTLQGMTYDAELVDKQAKMDTQWWKDRGYSKEPPEEIECDDCSGTGTVEHEITLEAALNALGR